MTYARLFDKKITHRTNAPDHRSAECSSTTQPSCHDDSSALDVAGKHCAADEGRNSRLPHHTRIQDARRSHREVANTSLESLLEAMFPAQVCQHPVNDEFCCVLEAFSILHLYLCARHISRVRIAQCVARCRPMATPLWLLHETISNFRATICEEMHI